MIIQIETANFTSPTVAADALDHVGKALLAGGDVDDALEAFTAAADIDLAAAAGWQDAEPVPWDADEARTALFASVLQAVQPGSILQAGVERGETTAWIATAFGGPILASEPEPRLFLQACRLLARYRNVSLFNEELATFLRMTLPVPDAPAIVCLGKPREGEPPLAGTVWMILERVPRGVILIDGIRSPGAAAGDADPVARPGHDPGLLEAFADGPARVFLADLARAGAAHRRNSVCVVAAAATELAALETVAILRPVDWPAWRIATLRAEVDALRGHVGWQSPAR